MQNITRKKTRRQTLMGAARVGNCSQQTSVSRKERWSGGATCHAFKGWRGDHTVKYLRIGLFGPPARNQKVCFLLLEQHLFGYLWERHLRFALEMWKICVRGPAPPKSLGTVSTTSLARRPTSVFWPHPEQCGRCGHCTSAPSSGRPWL